MTNRVLISLSSPYDFWDFGRQHAERLHTTFPEVTFLAAREADVSRHLAAADIYFGWTFPAGWIEDAPRLRWIATPSAGVDHFPVEELRAAGIGLTRGVGYHAQPVTEHALGLLLGFSRGLFLSRRLQSRSRWWKDQVAETFFDLHGQTLAIVGCGVIGIRLAAAAQALGMHVIGLRRSPPPDETLGIEWVPASRLHEALARSRAVVDLLPATDETLRVFDASAFAACRPGAVFINLGRASTVDHEALLQALDSGHISAAALDVPPVKPPPADDPLRHHPRVVLTPKSAVFSHDYMDKAVDFFRDNLRLHLNDRPLNGTVIPLPEGDRHVR
ncbi:D-2-hydroxyacid dehydrogenase [Streptomyces sp. NPDC006186]|uniref:D-2-hydroxyacid dehydrogenase n=1 Tax=Streptomyces sp. NPDC006186 TaxID=3155248 RepID=UPI0033AA3372